MQQVDRAERWEEESHILVQTRLQGMSFSWLSLKLDCTPDDR